MVRAFIDKRGAASTEAQIEKLRKQARLDVLNLYPDATDFDIKTITHGIPNSGGEVRPGTVVIRTTFTTNLIDEDA